MLNNANVIKNYVAKGEEEEETEEANRLKIREEDKKLIDHKNT